MPDENVGAQLLERGWCQGCIFLGPLPGSPYYDVAPTQSSASKSHVEWATLLVRPAKPTDRWIVTTQTCDILRKSPEEPVVEAIRVYRTNNERILSAARGKSVRTFLISLDDNQIADATMKANISKQALLTRAIESRPYENAPAALKRFQAWLARRYARPAVRDDLIRSIHRPIVEAIETLGDGDPILAALNRIDGIHYKLRSEGPPFEIEIVFILEDEEALGDSEVNEAAATVAGWLSDVLKGEGAARIVYWDTLDIWSISLGDFMLLENIYLDHMSG